MDVLATWPWPQTTPGWPKPACGSRSGRARPSGASGPARPTHELLDLFWDEESGGFFSSGSDAETLVVRPKEFLDGALPSTNSIAVSALLRVNALVDDARLDAAVERTIALARPLLERHPGALPDLVAALPLWTHRHEIVITGERPDLLAEVRRRWLPTAVLAWGEPDDGPLFRRPARPTRPGLRLPGPIVPDAGG